MNDIVSPNAEVEQFLARMKVLEEGADEIEEETIRDAELEARIDREVGVDLEDRIARSLDATMAHLEAQAYEHGTKKFDIKVSSPAIREALGNVQYTEPNRSGIFRKIRVKYDVANPDSSDTLGNLSVRLSYHNKDGHGRIKYLHVGAEISTEMESDSSHRKRVGKWKRKRFFSRLARREFYENKPLRRRTYHARVWNRKRAGIDYHGRSSYVERALLESHSLSDVERALRRNVSKKLFSNGNFSLFAEAARVFTHLPELLDEQYEDFADQKAAQRSRIVNGGPKSS